MSSAHLTSLANAVLELAQHQPLLRARDLASHGLPTVLLTRLVPAGTFSAQGWGGHMVVVVPAYDLVVVHRVNTDVSNQVVTDAQFARLLQMILDARVSP